MASEFEMPVPDGVFHEGLARQIVGEVGLCSMLHGVSDRARTNQYQAHRHKAPDHGTSSTHCYSTMKHQNRQRPFTSLNGKGSCKTYRTNVSLSKKQWIMRTVLHDWLRESDAKPCDEHNW